MELKMSIEIPQNLWANVERNIINAQTTLTAKCKEAADVYTPLEQGTLKNNIEYTKNAAGAIDGWKYRVPYARRQWFGKRKDGSGFNFSKAKNTNARSRWTEHAANVHREAIIKAVVAVLEL